MRVGRIGGFWGRKRERGGGEVSEWGEGRRKKGGRRGFEKGGHGRGGEGRECFGNEEGGAFCGNKWIYWNLEKERCRIAAELIWVHRWGEVIGEIKRSHVIMLYAMQGRDACGRQITITTPEHMTDCLSQSIYHS